jgi:hypothetical protein
MQMPTPDQTFKAVACWVFGLLIFLFVPEIIAFLWVGQ